MITHNMIIDDTCCIVYTLLYIRVAYHNCKLNKPPVYCFITAGQNELILAAHLYKQYVFIMIMTCFVRSELFISISFCYYHYHVHHPTFDLSYLLSSYVFSHCTLLAGLHFVPHFQTFYEITMEAILQMAVVYNDEIY